MFYANNISSKNREKKNKNTQTGPEKHIRILKTVSQDHSFDHDPLEISECQLGDI